MNRATLLFAAGLVWLMGCSEPAKEVVGTSTDGQFELVLRADPNWVRPDASLPVEVQVVRLVSDATVGFGDRIEFVVNNGSVSPTSLNVSFDAASGGDRFTARVTFRASRATEEAQGEIHAYFRGALATLKVRIVPLDTG